MKFKKIMAIVNPQSGMKRGMKWYQELVGWRDGAAREAGIKVDISLTDKSKEGNATNLAKRAVNQGYDLILIVGGDGTVSQAVNGVVGSSVPVLIACAGNGNDFGVGIGAPKSIGEVINLVFHGAIRSVDLMTVNGRACVNVFGVGGIDTRVVDYVETTLKKKRGLIPPRFLYFVALIRELLRFKIKYPHLKLEAKMPGSAARTMEGEVTLLVIGNGPTCGGVFRLTPQADLADGLLDVCWIRRTGRIRILESIVKAMKGTHLDMPEVVTLSDGTLPRLTSFSLSSKELVSAQIDGEIIPAAKEFKVAVMPQALKVLALPLLLPAQIPLTVKTPELEPA